MRATYANGVLMPLEPLDLEEGELLTISIEEAPVVGGGLAALAKRHLGFRLFEDSSTLT